MPVSVISYWTPRNPFGSCTTNSSPLKFYSIPYVILTISQREQGIGVSWAIWTQTWQGGMAGCHSNVLKEPVDVIVGLFTIRSERFWSLGEGTDSQERPQIQGLFSKRLKTIREITRCSLASALWEIMEHILSKVLCGKKGENDDWE